MEIVNIFILILDKENGAQKVVFPGMQLVIGKIGIQTKVYMTFPYPCLFQEKAPLPQTTHPLSETVPNSWVRVRHYSWSFLT